MPFRASWTQKQLADELAQRRKDLQLSLRDVAELTGWQNSKVSRMENCVTKITSADVRGLANVYGLSDADIDRLSEMARDSITDAWWKRYERWLSASFVEFLSYENEAARAWSVQHMFVPGLLQTPDYITSILEVGPLRDPGRNDAEYEVRLRRQQRLSDETDPLVLNALIVESILHWQIGGKDVLVGQLKHLCDSATKDNVHIRVVPFERPVTIYPVDLFEPASGQAVVFGEASWGTPMYDDPMDVREMMREIARVEAAALSEEETIELIEQRIRELTR